MKLLNFMKEIIRTDSTWMKRKLSGSIVEYMYGLRDGTNNRGHRVFDGEYLIFDRCISGANLVCSGSDLIAIPSTIP